MNQKYQRIVSRLAIGLGGLVIMLFVAFICAMVALVLSIIALSVITVAYGEGMSAVCFDSQELANKFLAINSGKDFVITVPCPNHSLLNQTFEEDESGK